MKRIIYRLLLICSRIIRFFCRAVYELIMMSPIFALVLLAVFVFYLFGNYANFIAALKQFQIFILSVCFTTYFIAFYNKERIRRRELKYLHIHYYYLIETMAFFIEAIHEVFNVELKPIHLYGFEYNHDHVYNEILNKLSINTTSFNWDEIIIYNGFSYSKRQFFNARTRSLFYTAQHFMNVDDSNNKKNSMLEAFNHYHGLSRILCIDDSYDWSEVPLNEIEARIRFIIHMISELERQISSPYRIDESIVFSVYAFLCRVFKKKLPK